jgi:hypothetical protein
MKKFVSLLKKKGACSEGLDFALVYADAKAAWEACTNPEYMLWAIAEFDLVDDKKHRLFACWCARHTPVGNGKTNWDLLTDERSRNAVIVAERFANGEATNEELAAARDAAWAAAWAAARDAARDAAWDAQAKALRDIYGFPFEAVLASKRKKKGVAS